MSEYGRALVMSWNKPDTSGGEHGVLEGDAEHARRCNGMQMVMRRIHVKGGPGIAYVNAGISRWWMG